MPVGNTKRVEETACRKRGPGDLPTSERLATLARAATDAVKHNAHEEHETEHGLRLSIPLSQAEAIMATWPDATQKGARQMLEQYGPPNEATPTKLCGPARVAGSGSWSPATS